MGRKPRTEHEIFIFIHEMSVIRDDGCIVWTGSCIKHGGHGQITHNYKNYPVHRLVYELVYGRLDSKIFVLHKCDTAPCINLEHLELGDYKKNNKDAYLRGRNPGWQGQRDSEGRYTPYRKPFEAPYTDEEIFELWESMSDLAAQLVRPSHLLGKVPDATSLLKDDPSWDQPDTSWMAFYEMPD